ncbi:MAG: SGNH/GDSL hydrolase family protein [Bacteroidales bacterium]|nr:SGNH/GDSL hydrolase family protein [Bacteroidales bacterium]
MMNPAYNDQLQEREGRKIVAFGDSIMRGVVTKQTMIGEGTIKYCISDTNFMDQYGANTQVTVENKSRYGSSIVDGIKNLERFRNSIKPSDAVVLEFGGNDCNFDWAAVSENPHKKHKPVTSIAKFRSTYEKIIRYVISFGAQPILLSLPAIDAQKFFDHISKGHNKDNILQFIGGNVDGISQWHNRYNQEVFKLGKHFDIPVIDITTVFESLDQPSSFLCDDGMHPNEAGHQLIANTIANYRL